MSAYVADADQDVAGPPGSQSAHGHDRHAQLCETCRRVEACDPNERRLSEWAQLDVTVRHPPATAPQQGLLLVAHPAAAGAEPERIELHLDGAVVATATVTCCPACRTASLDYVHVVAGYRRLGYGRTLVAAAHARAPQYRWTAPLPEGVVAQAFRARISYPNTGAPCVHRGHRASTGARWTNPPQ
ncbi:GNAT family N-acetyltransferase [Amycolatopsis sp. NPDC098790]|uniref:GNAT family N-acetyltransferase n=1 Tax=Amycolatopsis sp. NPDC098790 TaxID=3363939 RepID=UPI0038174A47